MDALTPELLLNAYANGYFPMAMARDDAELFWFSPEERGVIPLEGFNIPRGLKRSMKTRDYLVTVDQDFEGVIRGCAEITSQRDGTWINDQIIALYCEVHAQGHAHSVEVWGECVAGDGWRVAREKEDDTSLLTRHSPPATRHLLGGLYGISLGGAFFGESMFSRAPDASKIALVALVEILCEAGYELLDTQYVNDHLKQFGVMAVPKADYMMKLEKALSASPSPSSRFSTASVRKGFASASSESET